MIKQLWRWLMAEESDPKPTAVERFGDVTLDASLGLSILSEPKRRGLCQAIRERMEGIWREERVELVDRLFLRFALYVGDLQASEKHHHAVQYGLLDHSLEVAYKVASALYGPPFRISEDYGTNYREKPPWHYAALVCALLHDVGKVLDLEVTTPDGKDRWNPYVEPLALFCQRNGLKKTGPEFWHYRVGRGIRFHSWHGPMVFPLVLPSKATDYLGFRLPLVSDAMIAETLDRVPEAPQEVASRIARIIHEADIKSSKAARSQEAVQNPPSTPVSAPPTVPSAAPAPTVQQAPREASVPKALPVPEGPRHPKERPPLDLGRVLEDFTAALRAAVGQGIIPLNKEGGLYIGRRHVYLHYPDGMEKVLELMTERGSDLQDRFEEGRIPLPGQSEGELPPQDRVFQALIAHKRMPYSTEEFAWVQQGSILHPGEAGDPWWGQVVLMNLPVGDLPAFQGSLNLDQIGDPESDSATNPLHPAPKREPAPVVERPAEESYALRVHAELEPGRLLSTFWSALVSGVFHRPGGWSPVFIRPDFTWVLVPDTFKVLLPRKGILFTEELENRILQSIQRMPDLSRGEDGRVLFRIKVHPESSNSVWAFALDTRWLLTSEQLATLESWEHPVRVIEEPLPGEYAA